MLVYQRVTLVNLPMPSILFSHDDPAVFFGRKMTFQSWGVLSPDVVLKSCNEKKTPETPKILQIWLQKHERSLANSLFFSIFYILW